ncbi:hypothetical protein TSAR_002386, partial [Trichomalopsis sarcophagae]
CSEDQNIKQDLDHILWQCSIYNVQRSTLIEKLKQLKFQEPLASFVILCDPTSELCGTLLRFFRNCKLQILMRRASRIGSPVPSDSKRSQLELFSAGNQPQSTNGQAFTA